jgi:rod shape determining protein RodA
MYYVEKTKDFNYLRRFDYILFLSVILLSGIGLLVLSSAVKSMNGSTRMMLIQTGSMAIGIFLMFVISFIDYKDFKVFGVLFYVFTLALLVLVLVKGTGDELGSRSWLKIMGFSLQPAEFAKISFILVASIFLERIYDGEKNKGANIIKFLFYSAIPFLLVIAQKDVGTTMVFVFIFFVLIFVCGLGYKYIFMGMGVFAVAATVAWVYFLNDTRKKRIEVFLNPDIDPLVYGYNVRKSKIAIGSGQIFGKGLFKGYQTQNNGVPVKESDFIFSVIGEELGFIGAVIIIALVCFLLLRCIHIARQSRDSYGMFLVVGVASYLGIHFVENIGMSVGVLPVTGIPLPFISQGGTSVMTNFIGIGIVMSVSMRRQKVIF